MEEQTESIERLVRIEMKLDEALRRLNHHSMTLYGNGQKGIVYDVTVLKTKAGFISTITALIVSIIVTVVGWLWPK